LRRIKKRYETDCREYGREPTVAVEEAVAAAKKEADQMFFDVLGRKDRADATRNALNVMNRFDCVFFFQFPNGCFYPFTIAGSVFVLLYHQFFQA
jgi:hypothetical protein